MADSHSATGFGIDCFASPFGHTSLRCAGLEEPEARLIIFPVTLFLVGALVALGNWIRLGLHQQVFKRRHFALLVLYGFLAFSLGIADKTHPAGSKPFSGSRIIGGLSILPDILLIAVIYHFLPPHVALPWWLDRALAAASCSGLIVMLIGAIREYTPDGLNDYDRDNVYAAASCELVFLFGSLFASQCARYFAIMGEHGRYRTFINLDSTSNILFVVSLLGISAQTSLAFVQPPDFTRILASSMLGAVSYLLLIGVSVVQHLDTSDEPNDKLIIQREKSIEETRKEPEVAAVEEVESQGHDPKIPAPDEPNEVDLDYRAAQQFLQATEHQAEDPRVIKPGAKDLRSALPELENTPGADNGSVVWHGKYENRLRVHSGMSASSWGRLEMIMRSRKQGQTGRTGPLALRPQSGMTYYGSEASFPEVVSPGTRQGSFVSSKTGWRSTFLSHGIPPVPPIAPKFLRRAPSPPRGAFAMPLTAGETPIPLEVGEPKPTGDLSPDYRAKTSFSSLTGLFRTKKDFSRSNDEERGAQFRSRSSESLKRGSLPFLFGRNKTSTQSDLKVSAHNRALHSPVQRSNGEQSSLPLQYQSSKLFPLPSTVLNNSAAFPQSRDAHGRSESRQRLNWRSPGVSFEPGSGDARLSASSEDASTVHALDFKHGSSNEVLAKAPSQPASFLESLPLSADEPPKRSVAKEVPKHDMQHIFVSSFRSARIGSPHTIEEETEPTNDTHRQIVSTMFRNSDLSITNQSDESSPRKGKLQKETHSRVDVIGEENELVPDGYGGMIRRQRSEPTLSANRMTRSSTDASDSTESSHINDEYLDARAGSGGSHRGVPDLKGFGTAGQMAKDSTLSVAEIGLSRPPTRSDQGYATGTTLTAECRGWTRTDADDEDARTIRDVSKPHLS